MKSFTTFYFERFYFDRESLVASFYYSFDREVQFEEKIDFSSDFLLRDDIDYEILDSYLFHLHIALGVSYYKAFPQANLVVESGKLDAFQLNFWKNFYTQGLGEFFYLHQISPENLCNFSSCSDQIYTSNTTKISDKYLIPLGGGKDSIVSIEILKEMGVAQQASTFVFGKLDTIKSSCIENTGLKNLLVKRTISSELFKLNDEGYYNGHVPITGIIAFAMQVVGYMYDYKYLVLSNEKSANSGNVNWSGFDVNHQYSKSLGFEVDFSNYVTRYLNPDIRYFSLLRGMYETKIAEIFSKKGKKYFSDFSSCNSNFTILKDSERKSIWCNKCPKCAFVFSILYPYLTQKEIGEIFGEDLYEREDLKKLFKELLGISGIKPFECVGEAEEVVASMKKSLNKISENNKDIPGILQMFLTEVDVKMTPGEYIELDKKLGTIYDEDIIPKEIKEKLIKLI